MRFVTASSVLCSMLALGQVQAADLGVPRSPVAATVVAEGFSWTALYGGLHAGHGFSNTTISVPGFASFSGVGANGWLIGGKIGADWQVAQRFVIGALIEGDLSRIDTTLGLLGQTAKISADRRWAVRGRAGYLLTPETMVYATAGWSQGHASVSVAGNSLGLTTNGWQVGGGVETRIANNWFAHAEYVHTFTNALNPIPGLSLRPQVGTARAGVTYRFGLGGSQQAAFAAPRRGNWSGFHIGVQGGYALANTTLSVPGLFSLRGLGAQGLFGGILAGYDHQFAGTSVVLGVEADASLSAAKTSLNTGLFNASLAGDWDVGVRARLGYVLGGSVMPYVSAGYGFTHVKLSSPVFNASDVTHGFQLGGGVETLLTPNLSLRAEYIHSFGTTRDVIAPLRYRVESGRARLGLSWKFGGETAAVVARY